jgi:CubicO group peptidase (beta-lactamase class C family)
MVTIAFAENMTESATVTSSPPNIAKALQPFVERGTMAGAVTVVATKDKLLSLDAIGYADLAAQKPMTTEDVFWIASMTKPMTATAFMTLVEKGLIGIEDPVEQYLPEFKGQMVIAEKDDDHILLKKPRHPITVREILNHTAGLSFASAMETPTLDRLSLEHQVRSYAMTSLLFEPGTQFLYSNSGTNTVGRLIEVLSGMPYEDFMQERFFTPLGMKDTTFWPSEEQLSRLAKTYVATKDKTGLREGTIDQLSYPLTDPKRRCMPAGGLFSTARDVLQYCRMILSGGEYQGRRYLSQASIDQMTTKQTGAVTHEYGFCWNTEGGDYRHGGAFKTMMLFHRKLEMVTIFLVQQSGDWPHADGETIFPTFIAEAEKLARSAA